MAGKQNEGYAMLSNKKKQFLASGKQFLSSGKMFPIY